MATVRQIDVPVPAIDWRQTPALAAVWPASDDWPLPRWLAEGTARIVKRGPQRTVFRVDLPGLSIFLKQHHIPNRLTWWRQRLRAAKARREFDRLAEFARRGLPAPQPLGWGARPAWNGVGESFLVTRAVEGVPLNRILVERNLTPAARINLASALGRFVARLHAGGVDHRDFHSGNILVHAGEQGYELFLVDLDAVHLAPPLSHAASLKSLAMFAAGCLEAVSRADRLRFLRAYAFARGWIDPLRDLAGERRLFDLARHIERDAMAYNLAYWKHRDRRCLVSNRYYEAIASPTHAGMAVRGIDEDWLRRFAADPDALFREPGVRIIKHSKTSTVAETTIVIDGQTRSAILKKIPATRWTDPFTALFRRTSIARSWIWGQGMLERNLPTPRPLAMLHRRRGGLPYEGYLITEKLEGVQELDDYVAGLDSLAADERRRRIRRQIDRVARAIRELHRRRMSHRDLKAANILVNAVDVEETPAGQPRPIWPSPFPVRATTLWFIDLVGVTLGRRLAKRRKVQNLARLNASFLRSKTLTRTDRLRFLRTYLAWNVHGKGTWKTWWRRIAAATAQKIDRNRRSGRVLE